MEKKDIHELVAKYANCDEVSVTDDTDLFKDLKYDSLSFVELIARVEELIGTEFEDMDELFDKTSNVGNLCSYILGKVNETNES